MLKIRLQRVGRKHEPVFRVVLTDSKNGPKSGKFIEILGSYDARDKNDTQLKVERINHWIEQGAQPSDTLHNLLVQKEIIKGEKRNVLPKKSPIKKEEEEKPEEAAKEESPATEGETVPEAPVEEAPAEEKKEEETPKEEKSEEAPVEEKKEKEAPKEEEKPAEETKEEEK